MDKMFLITEVKEVELVGAWKGYMRFKTRCPSPSCRHENKNDFLLRPIEFRVDCRGPGCSTSYYVRPKSIETGETASLEFLDSSHSALFPLQ